MVLLSVFCRRKSALKGYLYKTSDELFKISKKGREKSKRETLRMMNEG